MIIIDGNSLVNRAFYALPDLTTSQGLPTNAVYGFITMLLKIIEDYNPEYISVAFDRKEATFRHKEYADYKAQRKGMPEDLAKQMPFLKGVLDVLGINRLEVPGFEADDIIGTLSRQGEEEGKEVFIVTGDRDALQLVSDDVKVIYTKKGVSDFEIYDVESIRERYGLEPEKLIDIKGLMGDKSDNIPGVPGIGEKTALKLIKQFGSFENVLKNIDSLPEGRLKENLENNIQQAVLSKRLATIHREIPIVIDIAECKRSVPDVREVTIKLSELEFNSLIERVKKLFRPMDGTGVAERTPKESNFVCLRHIEDIETVLKEIKGAKSMAFEIVTDIDNNNAGPKIYGLSVAWGQWNGVYIPINHKKYAMDEAAVFKAMKPIMEDGRIQKFGHRLKQDILILNKMGINLLGYSFDAEIFAYLLDPLSSNYDLERIAIKYLGTSIIGRGELLGEGKEQIGFDYVEMKKVCQYLADRIKCIFALKEVMEKRIKSAGMEALAREVELPLIQVLADMQRIGIKLDRQVLDELSMKLDQEIKKFTREIYALADEEFNINSPKQLSEILFVKLGLPVIKRTKTGYSTDVDVLERLEDIHPIAKKVLEYRQFMKLRSTYIDGLIREIDPYTGRIHSNFKQTVTSTGRISSTEPNLQNIPIRFELGRGIRRAFIPGDKGNVFVTADYSQIELRVLAHVSGDKGLINAFKRQLDIHTQTAAQVFGVTHLEVTPAMRDSAKAVNFGIIYGISDYGLSQNLRIPRKKAAEYIKKYFENFSGVKTYMDKVIKESKKSGMVKTMLGRVRHLPELKSGNRNIRAFGERLAMNTPIQGSAADIIKLAMNKVHKRLAEERLEARLVLQVHDELIVETPKGELERVKRILKECMERAIELKVPLVVKMSVGENWYEAK